MIVVCDNREQTPWRFSNWPDIEVRAGTLNCGDYSLCGLENAVAVERKSLDDLVSCLGAERSRFERELARLRGLDFAAVYELLSKFARELSRRYEAAVAALAERPQEAIPANSGAITGKPIVEYSRTRQRATAGRH